MINNYDLLSLGFSPKYKGFALLKEAINLKLNNIGMSYSDIYKNLNKEHPTTAEKNIRVCLMGNEKGCKVSVPQAIDRLCSHFSKEYAMTDVNGNPRVKFEKVSFKQFKKDVLDCGFKFEDDELMDFWKSIRLPRRATAGSAGYDFFAPFDLVIEKGKTLKFPTGIKCLMDDGVVLTLFPRSGLGFKYGMQLYNTCGVIDADYSLAKNEGHIHCKLHYLNNNVEEVHVRQGDGYMQGILLPFIKTVDDESNGVRVGGFGSTNGI